MVNKECNLRAGVYKVQTFGTLQSGRGGERDEVGARSRYWKGRSGGSDGREIEGFDEVTGTGIHGYLSLDLRELCGCRSMGLHHSCDPVHSRIIIISYK